MKSRAHDAQPSSTKTDPAVSQAQSVPLHARFGNQSVERLLQTKLLQAKLTISDSADPLEQEADRLARDGAASDTGASVQHDASALTVQRACSGCEEDLRRKPLQVGRAEAAQSAPTVDGAFEQKIRSLPSRGGDHLPKSVHPFVQRLGVDPSAVRVHMDANLASSAQAKAFTVGNQIVFNPTHYAPGTKSGDELIRHECVHVAQQGQAPTAIQRQPETEPRFPRLGKPLPPIDLRNIGGGTEIDGTPLPANEWLKRYRERKIRANEETVLRLLTTGEIVTDDRLVEWALAQKVPEQQLENEIVSGHWFAGSPAVLEGAVKRLRGSKSRLDDSRRQKEEARQKQEAENRQFAERQRQQKAELLRSRLFCMQNSRGKVTSAMAALRNAGPAAETRGVYHSLRGAEGKTSDVKTDTPEVDVVLRDLARESAEKRLKLLRLSTPQFERLVSEFETSFRDATVGLAFAALDSARDRALEFRDDVNRSDALASSIIRSLYPVRKSLVPLFDRVRILELDGSEPGGYLAREEAKETRKVALDLEMYALNGLPFIRLPDFPLEKVLRSTDHGEVRNLIVDYLNDYVHDIRTTRELLQRESTQVYKLDVLLAEAKKEFGIERGSLFEMILQDAAKDASEPSWPDKLKTLLMFAVLAVSVLVPGGVIATGAAWIGAGVAVHDAWQTIGEYKEEHAAYGAGLRSADPSLVWVVVGLVTAALAVYGAGALFKNRGALRLRAASERFARTGDLDQLSRDLQRIPGLTAEARAAIESQARQLRSALQPALAGQPLFDTMDEAGFAALSECNPTSVAEVREYGGLIYKTQDGRYGYTKPVPGGPVTVDPYASPAPQGTKVVGEYHSHADYSDGTMRQISKDEWVANRTTAEHDVHKSDFYSDNDFNQTLRHSWKNDLPDYTSYLGTPSGDFFKAVIAAGGPTPEPIVRWLDPDLFSRR